MSRGNTQHKGNNKSAQRKAKSSSTKNRKSTKKSVKVTIAPEIIQPVVAEKRATVKPASFSATVEEAPEVAVKVVEKKATTEVENVSKKFNRKAEEKPVKINFKRKEPSKIIIRDVERTDPKLTEVSEKQSALPSKSTPVEAVRVETPVVKMPQADLSRVNARMQARKRMAVQPVISQPKMSAKEIKEREIEKAMASTVRRTAEMDEKREKRAFQERFRMTWGRVVLAMTCATAAIFALAYFINLSSTDVSLKVAAAQSGIEVAYPSYVPRDFSISDITSEENKVTLRFQNSSTGVVYTITEEKSSWDSNAVLSNYVKKNYGEDYTAVREQGLTLYMGDDWAAWVNGGIFYSLSVDNGSLTKKQIKSIAVSV